MAGNRPTTRLEPSGANTPRAHRWLQLVLKSYSFSQKHICSTCAHVVASLSATCNGGIFPSSHRHRCVYNALQRLALCGGDPVQMLHHTCFVIPCCTIVYYYFLLYDCCTAHAIHVCRSLHCWLVSTRTSSVLVILSQDKFAWHRFSATLQ